ncbi:MAG: hypothetical protein KDK74_11285 [Cephaloticoccus sp.]|nr:hypothetical protein [Cephaloticoccus sp.]
MTHTKFIELLNLYLDHEISMEEAAALEAEIQRDPKRRAIYRQYCQMQRGCTELAAVFAADEVAAPERRTVAPRARENRSVFSGWMYGTAAAAACAVFTLVSLTRQPATPAPDQLAATEPAIAPTLAAAPQAAPSVYSLSELTAARPALHAVYTPTLVNLTTTPREKPALYATAAGDRFDWMDEVKLAPVEGDEFSFRVRPVVVEGERTYRSQRPFEGKVEMTAFQFQR